MSAGLIFDNTPIDPDDELLVAYVDGELDPVDRGRLENRLLEDETLRRRLQELQVTWDYLDDLPGTTPNEKLVESTMELVVADLVQPEKKTFLLPQHFRLPIVLVATSVLCAAFVFVVFNSVEQSRYRQQLADLAFAENLDAYLYGHDLQLIRDLAFNESWLKTIAAMKEIGDMHIARPQVSHVQLQDREQVIDGLSIVERAQLDSRWNRFTRLEPQQQQRIRQTKLQVDEESNTELLFTTMQAYALWRETLPSELRDKIESQNIDERREAIKQAIDKTQMDLSARSGLNLSDNTIEGINYVLQRILDQRIQENDPAVIAFLKRLEFLVPREQAERFAIHAMAMNHAGRPERRTGAFGGGMPRSFEPLAPLTNEELSMIDWVLSESDREIMDFIAGNPRNPMLEAMTLRTWAEEAARRKIWSRGSDSRTLIERYQQLDVGEREAVDLMPVKEMLDRLTPEGRRFRGQ